MITAAEPAASPQNDTAAQVTQYVTAAVANIRSGPGLNHRVVGTPFVSINSLEAKRPFSHS